MTPLNHHDSSIKESKTTKIKCLMKSSKVCSSRGKMVNKTKESIQGLREKVLNTEEKDNLEDEHLERKVRF